VVRGTGWGSRGGEGVGCGVGVWRRQAVAARARGKGAQAEVRTAAAAGSGGQRSLASYRKVGACAGGPVVWRAAVAGVSGWQAAGKMPGGGSTPTTNQDCRYHAAGQR